MTQAELIKIEGEMRSAKVVRIILVLCGVVSSLAYIGADIAAAMSWDSYSYINQSISELFAIGSPVKWIFALIPYSPLVIAFGLGVWWSAGRRRALRISGILLACYGIVSQAGSNFPMHLRGAAGSLTDIMHIVMTAVLVLLIVLFIGFGANAAGKWFRFYSIGTIGTLLVFGALAGMQGPQIAANLPTPWLGILERVNVYSSMLWVATLSVRLVLREKEFGAPF
jgi:hypothetical protein